MLKIECFEFSPFRENTYVLYTDTAEAVIVDPGCYHERERVELQQFIDKHQLKVVGLWLTHCHIDHIFGNAWVQATYSVSPEIHADDLVVLERMPEMARKYGLRLEPSPTPVIRFTDGMRLTLGNEKIEVLHLPGHSPGSVGFYHKDSGNIIQGDVLFRGSIGRTDLPGGNFDQLIHSIQSKLFRLPDDTVVWNGHGPCTTIGYEKQHNPFLVP